MSAKHLEAAARYNVKIVNEPRKTYYVYRYSVGGVPFYVGVGTRWRYLGHLVRSHSVLMRRKLEKLRRDGTRFSIKVVLHTNDRDKANAHEIALIHKYGRLKDGGTLYNIALGGDGGDTIGGKKKYHNPRTGEQSVFVQGQQPKGWRKGALPESSTSGYVDYYNPETNEHRRVPPDERPPRGWIFGRPRMGNTGPIGRIIIHNSELKTNKWIHKDEPIPRGWARGRLPGTTTQNRTAYHDPVSGKKKYLLAGERPPKGWKRGIPPTTGKPVKIGNIRFESEQAAMAHFKLSRYRLRKRSDFKQL